MCQIQKEDRANEAQPFNPAQPQNGQPFNPAQNGQAAFGTPQAFPGQQQPAYGNQAVQYGGAPVQGQYQK